MDPPKVYRGRFKNGFVELDDGVVIPEGTKVIVRLVANEEPAAPNPESQPPKTLYERMKHVIGSIHDLPPDAAINHDYYLYGTPKQEPDGDEKTS